MLIPQFTTPHPTWLQRSRPLVDPGLAPINFHQLRKILEHSKKLFNHLHEQQVKLHKQSLFQKRRLASKRLHTPQPSARTTTREQNHLLIRKMPLSKHRNKNNLTSFL